MKITQLVATKTKTPYHESVASRLPRGIKTQQQLLNLGYGVAVQDLGLDRAKSLNENFAAKLINSYHNQSLNEGVGSFLGRAAGNVAGAVGAAGRGLKGAWNDAKQGYKDAKGAWDANPPTPAGTAPAGGSAAPAAAPTSGGAAPAGGSAAPAAPDELDGIKRNAGLPTGGAPASGSAAAPAAASAGGDIGSIMKAIDALDSDSKKQLAGELDKSINTPPAADGATPPEAPQYTDAERAAHKAAGGKYDNKTGQMIPPPAPGATPPATEPAAPQGQALDLDQLKKDREAKQAAGQADQQQAQQQMAATAQANADKSQKDAAIKAAADAARAKSGFQQTAADKLAIKAADDAGIREEDEEDAIAEGFHSKFLGMMI
jgi:hypothetical protein